jgi:signal transduction histidine kinase
MNHEVEIRIVVAIAAVLVLVSLTLCVFALRHDAQRGERFGFVWLFMTNLAFLIATLGLMANPNLPFWVSAALVISGAHLGIVFGYFAVRAGLGRSVAMRRYVLLAVLTVVVQANVALISGQIGALVLTSSVINGLLALHMARRIWPLAQTLGPEIAALASLPFAAIGAAYLFRLPLLVFDVSPATMTVATLVITFLLAFSALQWAFALIAFRAARLNSRLETARNRAEAANQLKTRFLANMSHELRTPLNGVLGMAQVLEGQVAPGDQQRMVETIRTSGEGLMAILNDILDLSTVEAGAMELNLAPFRPVDAVERIVQLHAPQAAAKGLGFEWHCAPALRSTYRGDSTRLVQILGNIVGNAVKFTASGQVTLRAEADRRGLRFVITDTGIGMDAAEVGRIFDAFAQADASATRRFGGTGLGMPIVQRLVALMEGRVTLRSEPGQGTEVQVFLPLPLLAREATAPGHHAPPSAPAAADPSPLKLEGLRILVAEDNLTNQKVIGAFLRGSGVRVDLRR